MGYLLLQYDFAAAKFLSGARRAWIPVEQSFCAIAALAKAKTIVKNFIVEGIEIAGRQVGKVRQLRMLYTILHQFQPLGQVPSVWLPTRRSNEPSLLTTRR